VAGSPEALRERPFLVLYPEPIAPLILPDHVIERIFVAADRFLPQMMGPAMQPGATSPVTLAGAVAQGVAESFMCLTTAQLRNPGCPVGLGCNFGNFDMNQGLMGVGNPEMSLALAAQAEVAQSFGLPTWGLAGGTDAKVLDAQAGAEAAFHALAQAQAGLNLIHDVGYMDMSMACGLEQLVLGNEIIGMVKRFLNGIEVSRDRIALEVIARVGHGGHFLGEEHTMQYFKAEQWRPALFTRKPHKYWEAEGAKDTRTRVREKIQNILETHEPPPLPDSVLNTLERMKQEAEREILGSA
jgi:trimethylamine--corrinoid protein Co-methyltransferase